MLARTLLHVPQSQCSTSLSLRAPSLPLYQGRLPIVSKVAYSSHSSSPRSESWKSSWRTELEQGSNGNGNGGRVQPDEDYQTEYIRNGNGYHSDDTDTDATWGKTSSSANWRRHAADEDVAQYEDEDEEPAHSNSWHFSQYGRYSESENVHGQEDPQQEQTEQEEPSGEGSGIFPNAFKEALKAALQRSPLYADDLAGTASADEEVTEPQPYENEVEVYNRPIFTDQFRVALKESFERQQAQMDVYDGGAGSDDEYPAKPYVPQGPTRREMTPIEEVIATALGASQLHMRRLTMMKNEIGAALEREAKQVERLEFALSKIQTDVAYYKTVEHMLEEERRARR